MRGPSSCALGEGIEGCVSVREEGVVERGLVKVAVRTRQRNKRVRNSGGIRSARSNFEEKYRYANLQNMTAKQSCCYDGLGAA